MRSKLLALFLIPLALGVVMTTDAQAKDKFRVKMKGCLQQGTAPNTFVLSNAEGYTRRNTTGMAPKALARTDDFIIVADKDKDLQSHVGKRVKVRGWMYGERIKDNAVAYADRDRGNVTIRTGDNDVTVTTGDNNVAVVTDSDNVQVYRDNSAPANLGRAEFKVTDIDTISGTCP